MNKPSESPKYKLTLLLLLLLLAGCGHVSTASHVEVQLPTLAQSARQPTPPPQCSPTCSSNAAKDAQNWLYMLTQPGKPASLASSPTTR